MNRICSFSIIHYIIMGLFISITNSCTTEVDPKLLPVVTSTDVTKTTEASAQTGGNITSDAGFEVIARGVCWGTSPNPTIENNKTSDAAGTGLFTSKLTGLSPSTIYYVRAYATNKKGTGYGLQVTFSTKSLSLITTAVTTITINSAKSGGTIATDGDSVNVSARGICWGIQSNPTIADSKTTDGKGGGKYVSSLTDLILGTTYYVRAYVTNSSGTIYGNEVSFITQDGAMTLTTSPATSITATSATIGGSVPNDGGAPVIERGLCLSKLPTPTITNKIANGSGTGSYASNITGLEANTTYYVRAYATNSVNTNYGNEISFTTKDGIVALTTIAATSITATSATIGGTITSDGGATITERGICWSKTTNPTTADGKSTNTGTLGSFSTNVAGLTIGAIYYVRSYATNSVGTSYGNEISFTTLDGTVILTTINVSSITAYSAASGGSISSDGGGVSITDRGICWSTSPSPSVGNNKVSNGTGIGVYTCSLSDLNLNTNYYLRAYATNSLGTFYGNEVNFTTQNGVISLTTTMPTAITSISAICGGNITSDGGGVIVNNRGICWSTSPNPTIDLNTKLSNGTGKGTFTNFISSLIPNITYYLRAFATNNVSTFYGNEISFTTPNTVTDIDGNSYKTVIIGTQTWMVANLKTTHYRNGDIIANVTSDAAWAALSIGAWCDYSNVVTNSTKYGHLYNWYAVADSRKIAPVGWHVATDAEWNILATFLGGETVAGGKLKEVGTLNWTKPNTGSTDEFVFSALPGGSRDSPGSFTNQSYYGHWWSSSEYNSTNAWNRVLYYNQIYISRYNSTKSYGFSVRCIKD